MGMLLRRHRLKEKELAVQADVTTEEKVVEEVATEETTVEDASVETEKPKRTRKPKKEV